LEHGDPTHSVDGFALKRSLGVPYSSALRSARWWTLYTIYATAMLDTTNAEALDLFLGGLRSIHGDACRSRSTRTGTAWRKRLAVVIKYFAA
jgi:hypothetical protein